MVTGTFRPQQYPCLGIIESAHHDGFSLDQICHLLPVNYGQCEAFDTVA